MLIGLCWCLSAYVCFPASLCVSSPSACLISAPIGTCERQSWNKAEGQRTPQTTTCTYSSKIERDIPDVQLPLLLKQITQLPIHREYPILQALQKLRWTYNSNTDKPSHLAGSAGPKTSQQICRPNDSRHLRCSPLRACVFMLLFVWG